MLAYPRAAEYVPHGSTSNVIESSNRTGQTRNVSSRIHRWFAVVAAVGVVFGSLAAPAEAVADNPPSDISELSKSEKRRLQNHIETGKKAYDNGNFETSLEEFQRAFELLRHPDFMYRVALAHDRLGNLKKAVEAYRRFLEMAPNADDRKKIERTIEELEDRLEKTRPTISVDTHPSGADVYLDGESRPRGVTDLDVDVEPGRHDLVIRKNGFQLVERTIDIERGEQVSLELELTPREPPESEGDSHSNESARTSSSTPVGPIVLLSLAGVSAGGAVAAGFQYDHFLAKSNRHQGQDEDAFNRAATRAETWQGIAWTVGAFAGATATAGIIWLILRNPGGNSEQASRLRVRPAVGRRTVGLELSF